MANPYQQQVFQRKMVYLGLVVFLLVGAWWWRENAVEPRAIQLGLLEESRGDVELLGSAARTALSGLRGVVTCGLWVQANKEQKKNQWNSLERTVKQLTRLQPHLITPWLFQSWNLSYNVAVESDRISDKYFYITRGIQLLAEGERQNRYQPNLRRDIGFYTQHKICLSDENNTLRSLFQLSCIPPVERDPANFRDEKGTIDLEKLARFCETHPQLARRLYQPPLPYNLRREHRKFRCANANELVQFLDDNKNLPSLFVGKLEDQKAWRQGAPRSNPLDRFPVLPPARSGMFNPEDLTAEAFVAQAVPDEVDAYMVGRAWYGYSQECIPPPADMPGDSQPPSDPARQRKPRFMATVIFRSSPARSQTYIAERLQQEGWYDEEQFVIRDWFQPSPSAPDRPLTIGVRRPWSADAYRRAHEAWRQFGLDNHLLFRSEAERENMQAAADAFDRKYRTAPGEPPRTLNPEELSERDREGQRAWLFLHAYNRDRRVTGLSHYYPNTAVEAQERTVKARKLLYQAEQLRIVSRALNQAMELYESPDAMQAWRKILEENPDYHQDTAIQEWTVEVELKYHRLFRSLNEDKLSLDLALLAHLGHAVTAPALGADWVLSPLFSRTIDSKTKEKLQPEIQIIGPFDIDSKGRPFIYENNRDSVLARLGLKEAPPSPSPRPGQSGQPPVPVPASRP